MKEIVEIIQQVGLSVGIIIYFIYKDFKQSGEMMKLMIELRTCIEKFEKILNKEDKDEQSDS